MRDGSQFLNDACCDEANLCDVNPGAKVAVVGVLVEMVAPMKVWQWNHVDPRSAHPFAAPHPALVTQEWASFYADPNQWAHDLAFPHMTVLIGLNSHENHYVEDLRHFSCQKKTHY